MRSTPVRLEARSVAALVLFVVAVTACPSPGGDVDLAWTGPKEYDPPPIDTLFVENLGVNDTVHVLQPGMSFSVERSATNTGSANVAAGYQVRERIIRWVFQAATGTVGWTRGDTVTSVVYVDTIPGPALAAGAAVPIVFDSIPTFPCGLYEEDLLLDLGATVAESDEDDNTARHFFFIPSTQRFNVVLDTLQNQLFHAVGQTQTYRFNVRPLPGAPGNPVAFITGFSFVATDGSTASVDRPLPVPVPPAGASVVMSVTPNTHNPSVPPPTPQVTGKLTVLSADGCIIRQTSAAVLIEHG